MRCRLRPRAGRPAPAAALLLLAAAAASCAPIPEPGGGRGDDPPRLVLRCPDGRVVAATFVDGDRGVLLESGGNRLLLPRAGDAWYADGEASFLASEDWAVLVLGAEGERAVACRAEPADGPVPMAP